MVDRRPANRFSLLLILLHAWPPCHLAFSSDYHPWSPIVLGRPLRPPVIPAAVLQAVSGGGGPVIPVRDLEEPTGADDEIGQYSAPSPGSDRDTKRRPPVRRYRRRNWRPIRRRRPYMGYYAGAYNEYRRSYNVVPRQPETAAADYRASSGYRQPRGSPRVMVEEERGFMADLRSLFGAPAHCLDGGVQYSCTLAPVCWLTGGIVTEGCESMLYSCCKPPEIGRRQADPLEKRAQDWIHTEPECGLSRHRQFSKRIIGGEKAKFAELPWQVHIRISSYQCGGVLINHWYIATAAHCVHRAKLSKITVHLGEYDTKDDEEEPLESQTYKVDHIIIHPDFRYMLTQPDRFDVALLHLDRPVFYQDNIIPICLPPSDISLEGKVGLVAGWGKTDNSFGKTGTNILHKVLVPVINNEECIRWHEDKNIMVQLHSEMFCAGHKQGKMDACLGDSGGPLIIHYNGRWTLIGITSAGFGCAVDKQPGIYHKIGKTANWIRNQVTSHLNSIP